MATEDCKRVPPKLVEVEPGHFVACHKLEKKFENGNYLFDLAKLKQEREEAKKKAFEEAKAQAEAQENVEVEDKAEEVKTD